MRLSDYYKGVLQYELKQTTGSFSHNLDRDVHLLIIWEGAFGIREKFEADVARQFKVLARFSVQWSPEFFEQNIKRFYKFHRPRRIKDNVDLKVRDGLFYVLIIEDESPVYRYRQNVSGPIQLVNTNVLDLKRAGRDEVGENVIHASGSPVEFFEQAALLLTQEQLWKIIDGDWSQQRCHLNQDLVGSNGWKDFRELFSVLKYGTDYVVSRNFEYLPDEFFGNDKDVDVFCLNYHEFIYTANATCTTSRNGNPLDYIHVSGERIKFDVRHPGEIYIDPRWLNNLVSNKLKKNSSDIFIPSPNDYFFFLLYHAALQKKKIKKIYCERLSNLANQLDLDFFDETTLYNPRKIANIIQGFLHANNYLYVNPVDPLIYVNNDVLQYIDVRYLDITESKIYALYYFLVPSNLRKYIPKSFKQMIRRWMRRTHRDA